MLRARVALAARVVERSSGEPVTDAVVTATASGRPSMTLPYDVYSQSTYAASSRGYAARWELSIERRGDHVRGLVLDAPTYPTLAVAFQPAPGAITWAPARERGVTSAVCATSEGAASVGQRCVDGDDEGVLGIGVGAGGSIFPVEASPR